MRRVLFVTGSRSDYDILYSVLRAVTQTPGLEPHLVVTGAHLSARHGATVEAVLADGWPAITRLDALLASDDRASRAKGAALQWSGLVDTVSRVAPDIVFAAMDREEAITTALTASYLRLPLVHLGGGDVTGDGIDDPIRHAVSQLAHFHFTHTRQAAERLIARGEASWRVLNVGAPGLDRLVELRGQAAPATEKYAVLIQHPCFHRDEDLSHLAIEALVERGIRTYIGAPNSDPGSHRVAETIARYCQRHPERLHYYGNLPRAEFLTLLRGCAVLVGNSSCGLLEAPFLRVPTIDIGERQRGRPSARSVIHVDYDGPAIRSALDRALTDSAFLRAVADTDSPYGDGHAGERIARTLRELPLDRRLLDKSAEATA